MKEKKPARGVREPIQVYLASDERAMLDQLAAQSGLSRAEVLRRGIRSFAAERAEGDSPLFRYMVSLPPLEGGGDVAERHDDYLADGYLDAHGAT